MNLVKINPKKNNTLMPGFNDVFNTIFDDTFFDDSMNAKVPATNISESHDQYYIELAAPGLKKMTSIKFTKELTYYFRGKCFKRKFRSDLI